MGRTFLTTTFGPYPNVRAIIFDLDGTLYQNEVIGDEVNRTACRYVAELKGVTEAAAFQLVEEERIRHRETGGTLSRAIESLGGTLEGLHERFAEEVHPEGILSVDPRVPGLLERLSRCFELVIYTNNNRRLSGRIMKEIGVDSFFTHRFTIEDFWRPKPDREAILSILETIGRRPEETLFVGDRYDVDLKLPAALGCSVCEAQTVDELLALEKLLS